MRLEIPVFGQQKSPINRAFRGTYLFYVPIMERVKGIEPSYSAWEADVLPLNYTRTDRTWMILAYPAEKIKREEGKKPADWCMGYKFK